MVKKANVLGTDYKIEVRKISEDTDLKENGWSGYCNETLKLIVVGDVHDDEFYKNCTEEERSQIEKEILRHELTHAFFNESGLSNNSLQYSSGWAKNEEMVDWFAIQSPKIFKLFTECGCL